MFWLFGSEKVLKWLLRAWVIACAILFSYVWLTAK